MPQPKPRNPGTSRPRRRDHSPSTGVMLQGRSAGLGFWDDDTRYKGAKWSKKHLHKLVRTREKNDLRRALAKGEDAC